MIQMGDCHRPKADTRQLALRQYDLQISYT